MAASGAGVLMLRAVELARTHGVPIHARSTFSTSGGTLIREASGSEQRVVSAVTHARDEVLFEIRGLAAGAGPLATVFAAFAREQVDVDTVVLSPGHESALLAFAVARDDVPAARRALDETTTATAGGVEIVEIENLGKVSVVGAGMHAHVGVAALMFRTLADLEVGVRSVSTSPIRISCLVDSSEIERSVRALHGAFQLADDVTPESG